jgi:WD40 repeat protein
MIFFIYLYFTLITKVWNIDKAECIQTLHGHFDDIMKVAIIYRGSLPIIASASTDQSIRIWRTNSADPEIVLEPAFICMYVLHTKAPLISMSVVLHTDEMIRLACGSTDTSIRIWDVPCGSFLKHDCGSSTPTNKEINVESNTDQSETGSGKKEEDINPHLYAVLRGHTSAVTSLAMIILPDPTESFLLSGTTDGTTRAWTRL